MTLKRLTRINLKNAAAYSVNVHGMFSSNLQAKEIREICNRVLIRAMCSSNWFSSNRQASFFAIRGIGNSRNTPITESRWSLKWPRQKNANVTKSESKLAQGWKCKRKLFVWIIMIEWKLHSDKNEKMIMCIKIWQRDDENEKNVQEGERHNENGKKLSKCAWKSKLQS